MPAENITITGNWTPRTDTRYVVYHQKEDLNGNYVTAETYT
jgi:hypothetical protein